MKIPVAKLSDDELEMQECVFIFDPATLIFHFRKFTVHRRACETSPWVPASLWQYPDPHKEGSPTIPEIPEWAETSAVSQISYQFKFQI